MLRIIKESSVGKMTALSNNDDDDDSSTAAHRKEKKPQHNTTRHEKHHPPFSLLYLLTNRSKKLSIEMQTEMKNFINVYYNYIQNKQTETTNQIYLKYLLFN